MPRIVLVISVVPVAELAPQHGERFLGFAETGGRTVEKERNDRACTIANFFKN
jgi:hypothetical protein